MPATAYAASVTDKLLRRRVAPEIWKGAMSWIIHLIVNILPLRFLVRSSGTASDLD